jgi:hypothetical protein
VVAKPNVGRKAGRPVRGGPDAADEATKAAARAPSGPEDIAFAAGVAAG